MVPVVVVVVDPVATIIATIAPAVYVVMVIEVGEYCGPHLYPHGLGVERVHVSQIGVVQEEGEECFSMMAICWVVEVTLMVVAVGIPGIVQVSMVAFVMVVGVGKVSVI